MDVIRLPSPLQTKASVSSGMTRAVADASHLVRAVALNSPATVAVALNSPIETDQ